MQSAQKKLHWNIALYPSKVFYALHGYDESLDLMGEHDFWLSAYAGKLQFLGTKDVYMNTKRTALL
jgi:hypothetical protein